MLAESNVPKLIPRESLLFAAPPGFPPLCLSEVAVVDGVIQFAVYNRLPFPLLYSIGIIDEKGVWVDSKLNIVLPFGRDEWQFIPRPSSETLEIRLGIGLVEIAVDTKVVELGK